MKTHNKTLFATATSMCNKTTFKEGTIKIYQKVVLLWAPPTSFLFSHIFLQYSEHTCVLKILNNHKIIGYFGYANDILIIYHKRITPIKNVLEEFNNIYCTLNLTTEE